MLQRWEHLTFLHWPFDPAAVQRLLPAGLQIDTFDGAAWVGLVPFLISDLRPPFVPAFPWLSRFPETNVRTYVRGPDGKPGVWFFTLEADRLLAVMAARLSFGLPYRWARMRLQPEGDRVKYESDRQHWFGSGLSRVIIEPGERLLPKPFDNFLTARFRLYSVFRKRIALADIEHGPWPLQRARVLRLEHDLFPNSGVPQPQAEPVVHFARSVDVRIGRLRLA